MAIARPFTNTVVPARNCFFYAVWLFCTSQLPKCLVRGFITFKVLLGGAVVMNKFLAIVCSLALALSVAGCAGKGKYPVGKGKAPPPPVVTKG